MAAPFGVDDRETADLLMENVMPFATAALVPSSAKIYRDKYGESDYTQNVSIMSSSQITIDALRTFRTVGTAAPRPAALPAESYATRTILGLQ